jgi:hypothetical protein
VPGRGLLTGFLVRQIRPVPGERPARAHLPEVSVEVRAYAPPGAPLEHVLAVIDGAAAAAVAEARRHFSGSQVDDGDRPEHGGAARPR